MNIEVNLEKLTYDEKKHLERLIEKSNLPDNTPWIPLKGELYWMLRDDGNTTCIECHENNFDKWRMQQGNCFRLSSEAAEYRRKLTIQAQWKTYSDLAWRDCPNVHNKRGYHRFFLAYTDHNLRINSVQQTWESHVYFPTKRSIEDAIKAIGEENIIKYVLEVPQ